jgi:biotin carboxylase
MDLVSNLRKNVRYTLFVNSSEQTSPIPRTENHISMVSVENYDTSMMLEYKIMEQHKCTPLADVVAVCEGDILRAHKVKETLGLTHLAYDYIELFRDKIKMKDFFSSNGIPMAPYRHVTSLGDISEFIETHQFPVVVKPLASAAGMGCYLIRDQEDLFNFIGSPAKQDVFTTFNLLIEKYMPGAMYTMDGIYHRGKVLFSAGCEHVNLEIERWSWTKPTDSSFIIEQDRSSDVFKTLDLANRKMLALADQDDSFIYHSEYFFHNGVATLCETTRRPGGSLISEMHRTMYGVDLKQWLIHLSIEENTVLKPIEIPAFTGIQIKPLGGKTLHTKTIPTHCPIPGVKYFNGFCPSNAVVKSKSYLDSFYHLLAIGKSKEEVFSIMLDAERWFDATAQYQSQDV